jgi:hypothetical protein
MPSVVQTFNEVSRLLDALPGIAVTDHRLEGQAAIFEILSTSFSSALTVQELCLAANAALEPPVLLRDSMHEGQRSLLLSTGVERFESIEAGRLQLLGIHIVWHLHATGALSADAANQLLLRWNAARVGA